MKYLPICVFFLFVGCCQPKYIERTETKIDTIYVTITKMDTIRTMVTRWMWKDSVLTAHVDTVTMKLWYKVTLRDTLIRTDTAYVYLPPAIIEKTLWEKILIWLAPIFIVVSLALLLVIWLRK